MSIDEKGWRRIPINPEEAQIKAALYVLENAKPPTTEGRKTALIIDMYQAMVRSAQPYKRGGLTRRQRECFDIIEHSINEYGHAPDLDTLARTLRVKKPTAHTLVKNICKRGFLARTPRWRSIEIIKHPDDE